MLSFNSLDAIALFGAHLETFAAPARSRPSGILVGCWGAGKSGSLTIPIAFLVVAINLAMKKFVVKQRI